MLILRGMPCEAALRRGLLWHSWLKNQILKINASYVVRMHSRPLLQEERESFELNIQPGGEFEAKLNDARKFVRDMVEGFSPAQLVDSGPLANLPIEVRTSIKSVIHREYLMQTMIEQSIEPTVRAIDNLESALKEFSHAWYRQPAAEEDLIRNRFEQVQLCAKTLHEKLGVLPEGIVLP